ncbi:MULTISPECIES: restriction endonuclease subunit S [Aeromonas]|nr:MULTISPECIES: restriction endonuclease subunit S [Aeromonas]MCV9384846.1 restriction endonuclease subunit S [Aeromonas hydrophila]
MSSEWPMQDLGSLISYRKGFAFKSKDYISSGVPIVRVSNFTDDSISPNDLKFVSPDVAKETPEVSLEVNDIVVATVGSWPNNPASVVGRTIRVPAWAESALMNQNSVIIRAKSKSLTDQKFIYYQMRSQDFSAHVVSKAQGSANQASITLDAIFSYRLFWPKVEHRDVIVTFLSHLDDRITLLRETNTTLEAIAQGLFKSWFVDFDPVYARARGEQPPGLAPEVAALFPDSFEESELGMIPKGWKLMPFGELLNHTIGGDWGDETPNDKNDTKVAIIRGTDMPDLQSGMIGRVPVRYTSQKKLATRKLQDGDLVLEVSGGSKDQPTGRSLYMTTGLLEQFDCPVEPASFCRLLRPISHEYGVLLSQHMTYIYADGKTWQYQNQSTGIANFQTTHFLETEVVAVPTDDVLKLFAETIRSMIDRSHLSQIAQLAALRDTLLPRLISGQLRLPEVKDTLEEII